MTLNLGSTLGTAFWRGLQQAVVQFGGTTLVVYQASGNWQDSLVAGGVAAFLALGFRGAVEGLSDRSRQMAGDVKPGDVQPSLAGKP